MNGCPSHGSLSAMTTTPTTLTLKLDLLDPIKGTVTTEDGASLPFLGWLELAAALEQATAPACDAART
jgi:hypothetical protein